MSDFEYDSDHVKRSVGGKSGHFFRRGFHIGMALIPWIYYEFGDQIAELTSLEPVQFAAAFGIILLILEGLRIRFGILIFGQREYEKHQISAVAWGALSILSLIHI